VRKRRWFSVHRWLGIAVGLWFALVGLTGSALVFEDTLDAWLNPALLTSHERGPWLTPELLLARVEDEHGELGRVERIRPPAAAGEVYRLIYRVQPNKRIRVDRIEATFAPVSGRLLGTRPVEAVGFTPPLLMKTIYEFHRNVLLGTAGSNIVGIAGFLLLASAITGAVTAWPRRADGWRRLVHVNLRAHRTRIYFDVHRSVGIVFALLLMLATLTGSTLVYLNYVRDLVNVFSPVKSFPTIPWTPGRPSESAEFGKVVEIVRTAYPDRAIAEIHVPFRQTGGYLFYLRGAGDEYRLGDTVAWVNPVTARILVERSDRTRTAGETLMHWFFPLHSGTAFGTPGMIAMCLTGLTPLLLVATGLAVWLRKRRGERIGAQRRRALRSSGGMRAGPTAAAGQPLPH
jgi:uncharacterized iron-regulated membrane protein